MDRLTANNVTICGSLFIGVASIVLILMHDSSDKGDESGEML